jgi:hypothetical protein
MSALANGEPSRPASVVADESPGCTHHSRLSTPERSTYEGRGNPASPLPEEPAVLPAELAYLLVTDLIRRAGRVIKAIGMRYEPEHKT